MYSKSPLHLTFRQSGYIFRYSLPLDVRCKLKRREIKIALRTYSFSKARDYSRLISLLVRQMITKIREGQPVTILTNAQILEIVKDHFLTLCAADEATRIWPGWHEGNTECLEAMYEGSKMDLAYCEYLPTIGEAQLLVQMALGDDAPEEEDITLDDFSIRRLCREMLKAKIKYAEIAMKRMEGDYSSEYSVLDQLPGSIKNDYFGVHQDPEYTSATNPLKADHGRSLSEVIELYSEECRRLDKWKPRTETELLTTFELLIRVLGNKPIKTISREDIAGFKSTLLKLPPNINKAPEYRNKAIPEIINFTNKHKRPLLSVVTVKKMMGRVTALFNYADTHGYIESNPASGITVKVPKSARTVIAPFSDQDLQKLFNCKTAIEDKFRQPYQIWILILAPFTGCRLDELRQLHLSDIRQEDGIWVLDINDKTPDKNLKTANSKHLIPLHPFLVEELRFPDFAEKLAQRREKRLFPELKKEAKGGYGRAMSRWFPVFRKKAGVTEFDGEGHKRVFHSFRHTFDTRLKHRYVLTAMIDELMGHSTGKLSTEVYGATYPVRQKLEDGVMKLGYDCTMFDQIRKCRFIKG